MPAQELRGSVQPAPRRGQHGPVLQVILDVGCEVGDRRVAPLACLLQGFHRDRVQVAADKSVQRDRVGLAARGNVSHGGAQRCELAGERGRLVFANDPQHFGQPGAAQRRDVERHGSDQQLVQEDAERVDVGAFIDVARRRVCLLRAGVLRRPNELAEMGEPGLLHRPFVRGLRDPEIDHLGNRSAVAFHDQHVRRLQVAMDHTLLVRMVDRMADREEEDESLPGGHPLAIAILCDGRAFDVLHHEVRPPGGAGAGVEDLGDVRVVHHRERLAFLVEAGEHLRGIQAELHDLERHAPANGFTLLGEIDRPHPPFAQQLDDAIAAEVLARGRRGGRTTRLSPELVAAGALECVQDQTLRTESLGIGGTELRSAVGAAWHCQPGRILADFSPAVTASLTIPYSCQVSRTGPAPVRSESC